MNEHARGDLVAVRYASSGTFGGMEYDWKVGVFLESLDKSTCKVFYLPTFCEYSKDVIEHHIVYLSDVYPVEKKWPTLKGCRIVKNA